MVTVDQVLSSLRKVAVTLELTTPACPFNSEIEGDVRAAIASIGVKDLNMRVTARVMEGRSLSMDELLPGVKNIIAVASGKGGVGKTTVSVNLALALANTGAKVGLLDADIYGPSVPLMLGLKASPEVVNNKIQAPEIEGVKVISMGFFYEQSQQAGIYRGPIVSGIVKQFLTDVSWGELDYLIIDLPPGTGDAPLTMAQTIPVTGIIIVTTPQDVAMNVAVKALGMFSKLNVPIVGVIENMSYMLCPHCNEQITIFGEGGGKRISEKYGIPFLGEIPLSPQIREVSDKGKPVIISDADSIQAKELRKVAKTVAGRISVIAADLNSKEIASNESTVAPSSTAAGINNGSSS